MRIIHCDVEGCDASEDMLVVMERINNAVMAKGLISGKPYTPINDWHLSFIMNESWGDLCPVHHVSLGDKVKRAHASLGNQLNTVVTLRSEDEDKDS